MASDDKLHKTTPATKAWFAITGISFLIIWLFSLISIGMKDWDVLRQQWALFLSMSCLTSLFFVFTIGQLVYLAFYRLARKRPSFFSHKGVITLTVLAVALLFILLMAIYTAGVRAGMFA